MQVNKINRSLSLPNNPILTDNQSSSDLNPFEVGFIYLF